MNRREFFGAIAATAMAATLPCRQRAKQRALYWVARDGRWDDPASWSFELNGHGGAGVPDETTDVYIPGPAEDSMIVVRTEGIQAFAVVCANITIGGSGKGFIAFDCGPPIITLGGTNLLGDWNRKERKRDRV